FSRLLPIINSGGKWQEGDGTEKVKDAFLMAPSIFPKKREEFDAAKALLEEKKLKAHEKLAQLVEEIGTESKGVMHFVSKKFLSGNAETQVQPSSQTSQTWGAVEFVQNSYFFLRSQVEMGIVT